MKSRTLQRPDCGAESWCSIRVLLARAFIFIIAAASAPASIVCISVAPSPNVHCRRHQLAGVSAAAVGSGGGPGILPAQFCIFIGAAVPAPASTSSISVTPSPNDQGSRHHARAPPGPAAVAGVRSAVAGALAAAGLACFAPVECRGGTESTPGRRAAGGTQSTRLVSA